MKKLITVTFITLIAACVAVAGAYEFNGESEKARPYEIVALVLTGGPVVTPQVSTNLGFTKPYFDKSNDPFSRAELELVKWLETSGKTDTLKDLDEGNLILDSYCESFLFIIPTSYNGTRDLLTANSVYSEGRIPEEWNQGSLPSGFNIAVSNVLVGWASDAAVVVPEGDVDYGNVVDSWPAALRNGSLRIFQAGALKKKVRAKYCGTKAASQFNTADTGYEFLCPFILEEKKGTKFDFVTPAGVSFPATPANLFLEVMISGACTRQRS